MTLRSFVKKFIVHLPFVRTVLYRWHLRRPYFSLSRRLLSQKAFSHHLCYDLRIKRRIEEKKKNGIPLVVIFVIHEPKFYGSLASTVECLRSDSRFHVIIIAAPCRGATSLDGEYCEDKAGPFLESLGLPYIAATNNDGTVRPLSGFSPDFVFFQQPYVDVLFKGRYDIQDVTSYAFVYYVSYYGMSDSMRLRYVVNWQPFFSFIHCAFMATDWDCDLLIDSIPNVQRTLTVLNKGSPKYETCIRGTLETSVWKMKGEGVIHVLWTPRWMPDESKDFLQLWRPLLAWAKEHPSTIEFAFRPHPAMLSEYIKQKLMTEEDVEEVRKAFAENENTQIDTSALFEGTFSETNILISDTLTSMSYLFIPYNRPIICTGPQDSLGGFSKLAISGMYYTPNASEVIDLLEKVSSGYHDSKIECERAKLAELLLAPLRERPFAQHVLDELWRASPPVCSKWNCVN